MLVRGPLKQTELYYSPSPERVHPGTFLLPFLVLPSPPPAGCGAVVLWRGCQKFSLQCQGGEVGKGREPVTAALPPRAGLSWGPGKASTSSPVLLLHRTRQFNFWIETVFCNFSDHRTLLS